MDTLAFLHPVVLLADIGKFAGQQDAFLVLLTNGVGNFTELVMVGIMIFKFPDHIGVGVNDTKSEKATFHSGDCIGVLYQFSGNATKLRPSSFQNRFGDKVEYGKKLCIAKWRGIAIPSF